jgi:hypothetical protein
MTWWVCVFWGGDAWEVRDERVLVEGSGVGWQQQRVWVH